MDRHSSQRPTLRSWTWYCFLDSYLDLGSLARASFALVPKSKRRARKQNSLSKQRRKENNVTVSGGQTIGDIWAWKLVSLFLLPLFKWPTLIGFRELVVVLSCCLLSTAVAHASIKCPPGCSCFDSTALDAGGFLSINCSNRSLLQYTLYYSDIKQHSTTSDNSSTIHVSDQSIHDVPKIYILDLSRNKLTSAKPDVTGELPSMNDTLLIKVHILNFSYNSIFYVQRDDLSIYNEAQTIDFSHNLIQWVDVDAFMEMDKLTFLNLSHNVIKDLENNTLQYLDNLQTLDLSYNNLHVFSLGDLPELSSLQYLYLKGNKIHSVTNSFMYMLPSLPQLLFLDLSSNHLRDIPSSLFQSLPEMRILNMANNSIQEINDYFLKGLYKLQDFSLDQNEISSINQPVFENTSLVKLSLASMPSLRNISHNAFIGLSGLVYLNISNNPNLSFLQPNLFAPLTSLQVLDVSSSGLTHLSQITFHENKNLHQIYLQNNPLSCSCTNAWLAAEVSNNDTKFVNTDSLYCLSHDAVHRDISNASLNCQEVFIHNISFRTFSKLGSQILFKCQHQADNPEIVKWTTPTGKTFYQHHFHPDASQHLLSPEDIQLDSEFHKRHYWHHTSSYHSDLSSYEKRVMVLSDGSLYIDYMLRSDAGPYKCQVSNAVYNHSVSVNLYVDCTISSDVKIFGCIAGLICAVSFFTLNLTYVIISWIARRLVNKRRREIIRQMLENLNVYKSMQIARIYENYTHQLNRVRNQYHVQCNRLHRNYNLQVTRMKRGCSNQVERVRENYNSKLTQLRDYSSSQIMQIRERANNQIVRIRDYGSTQLEKLRETYKLQQQHVLKLLDTMNLENCRNVVETECMRAESMMYDIDLLGDDDRTDSPTSAGDSEYSTAASSPSSSLEDHHDVGLRNNLSQNKRELSTGSSDNSGAIKEVQTTIDLEVRLPDSITDAWKYCEDSSDDMDDNQHYLRSGQCHDDQNSLQIHVSQTLLPGTRDSENITPSIPPPILELKNEQFRSSILTAAKPSAQSHKRSDSDGLYMTPEASPTKVWSQSFNPPAFQQMGIEHWPHRQKQHCDIDFSDDSDSLNKDETIV